MDKIFIMSLLRSLSVPLGVVIAKYFEPSLGQTAYIIGGSLAASLIEFLIAIFNSMTFVARFSQFIMFWRRRESIFLSNKIRIGQLTSFIKHEFPSIVAEYTEDKHGSLEIHKIKPGSFVTIDGQIVEIASTTIKQDNNNNVANITATYNPRHISPQRILGKIVGYKPAETLLRIYNCQTCKEKNSSSFSNWLLAQDISTCNVTNTFFTDNVQRNFVDNVTDFINYKDYHNNPLPHRRTFLLHGLPGSGKTSMIRCVLGAYKIFLINSDIISNRSMFNAAINSISSYIEAGEIHVIVIDEIDKMFRVKNREYYDDSADFEDNAYRAPAKTNVADLCSFLDGVMPNTGRIVIMTANDISFFDKHKALRRARRIDKVIEMNLPDHTQLQKTLQHLRPEWQLSDTLITTNTIAQVIDLLCEGKSMFDILEQPTNSDGALDNNEPNISEIPHLKKTRVKCSRKNTGKIGGNTKKCSVLPSVDVAIAEFNKYYKICKFIHIDKMNYIALERWCRQQKVLTKNTRVQNIAYYKNSEYGEKISHFADVLRRLYKGRNTPETERAKIEQLFASLTCQQIPEYNPAIYLPDHTQEAPVNKVYLHQFQNSAKLARAEHKQDVAAKISSQPTAIHGEPHVPLINSDLENHASVAASMQKLQQRLQIMMQRNLRIPDAPDIANLHTTSAPGLQYAKPACPTCIDENSSLCE